MLIIIHACVTNTFDILDIINCVYTLSLCLYCEVDNNANLENSSNFLPI